LPAARRKRGFTVPVASWIGRRAGEIGPLVARSEAIRENLPAREVERLFARADDKRAGRAAWGLLFYALWHRRHIERREWTADTAATLAEAP